MQKDAKRRVVGIIISTYDSTPSSADPHSWGSAGEDKEKHKSSYVLLISEARIHLYCSR